MRRNRVLKAKTVFALATASLICLAGRGQIIITNFPGLSYDDVATVKGFYITPPDTMGAAGTNQFVEFINGAFAVYDKAGVRQMLISDSNFWASAGINPATMAAGITQPRIAYDAASSRWFATELTQDDTHNQVLLARSDSANPGAGWKAVSFLANTGYADFDTLGVDSQGVYVGVNNFVSSTTGPLTGVSFFSIPKADLIADTPTITNLTRFDNLDDQTYGLTLQGVCNADAGPGHGVIIAIDNAAFNYIDRTTLNGSGAAGASLASRLRIPILYDSAPHPATQPGGATLDTVDDRFTGAIRQMGGYIFMANTISNTVMPGARDAVHWLVLNETNNAVAGEGVISDPSYDYFQPSITASHSGKILLAFNRCGTASPAGDISIYAALGNLTNGVVSMGPPFLLKQGTVPNFTISFDSAPYFWGDYSATMFDPTDENLVWTIQEIPASATAWGTQITLISLDPNRPTLNFSRSGSTATLSWPLSADPAYGLQASTILPNTAWTTVSVAPVVSINQRVATLTVTGPALYFRLKK